MQNGGDALMSLYDPNRPADPEKTFFGYVEEVNSPEHIVEHLIAAILLGCRRT